MLAIASKAVIIGFNTEAEPGAKSSAERESVSIRFYTLSTTWSMMSLKP